VTAIVIAVAVTAALIMALAVWRMGRSAWANRAGLATDHPHMKLIG